MEKHILITGGAGYIGSLLCQFLLWKGYNVSVVDNLLQTGEGVLALWGHPNYKFIKKDIRDSKSLGSILEDVDIIIHLAAIVGDPASKKFPKETVEINKDASIELIRMAQRSGIKKFIFFSTCSNYGIADPNKLSDEDTRLNPISLYAETKVAVEQYLLGLDNPGFLPLILRLATVFGFSPRMRFDLTVNQFVMEALKDRKLVIFAPNAWRPYIHIRDVCEAVITCLKESEEKLKGRVYNLGANGLSYTKMQIAELIKKHIPGTAIEIKDIGTDLRDYRVDFGRWARTFPFVPCRRVEDGIQEIKQLLEWKVFPDPLGSCQCDPAHDK